MIGVGATVAVGSGIFYVVVRRRRASDSEVTRVPDAV